MRYAKVPARRGAAWLNGTIHVLEKAPRPILVAALVFAALSVTPRLLGPVGGLASLAMLLLYPVLMAGLVGIARRIDDGQPATPGGLFAALREGRTGALVVLALPPLLFGLAVATGLLFALGADQIAAIGEGNEPDLAGLGGRALPWLLLLLVAGGLASFCATFFAVPLVMLDRVPPVRAIGASLKACAANPGAIVLFLLSLVAALLIAAVALLLAGYVLGLVAAAIGPTVQQAVALLVALVFHAGLLAVFACAHLLAWRDVFWVGADGDAPDPPQEVAAEF